MHMGTCVVNLLAKTHIVEIALHQLKFNRLNKMLFIQRKLHVNLKEVIPLLAIPQGLSSTSSQVKSRIVSCSGKHDMSSISLPCQLLRHSRLLKSVSLFQSTYSQNGLDYRQLVCCRSCFSENMSELFPEWNCMLNACCECCCWFHDLLIWGFSPL